MLIKVATMVLLPAGLFLAWRLHARTRSLWLIVRLHGMVDLMPQLAPFIRAWTGQ